MPISVHKTDINTTTTSNKDEDLTHFCPVLPKKTHPLSKCRAFQMKQLQERCNILKEHKHCFKCCSLNRTVRDCQMTLRCDECHGEKHCSAMLPEAAQHPQSPLTPEAELQDCSPPEVTSQCTEICGEGSPPRSCSKVCLAKVFPKGKPECTVKMHMILDDQSNCSLAHPEFFKLLGIEGSLSTYYMRMCAGLTEMLGRKEVGFNSINVKEKPCYGKEHRTGFFRHILKPHLKGLRTVNEQGHCEVGFVLGKAKLSPQPEPTIPHLELRGCSSG